MQYTEFNTGYSVPDRTRLYLHWKAHEVVYEPRALSSVRLLIVIRMCYTMENGAIYCTVQPRQTTQGYDSV